MKAPSASARTAIAAPAATVYALVTDIPNLSAVTPEFERGTWLDGAVEAAVGARFAGRNRRGWLRWSTTGTVTAVDRDKCFAFDVDFRGIPVARWRYDIVATGRTCLVEESTWDHRPAWFVPFANIATGASNRTERNRRNIERTLRQLKQAAENSTRDR
ncbi:SRPBCC family protein [Actinophytocola gossypii]|uniref:SRPBCC family protein n=1 Tax=Actinophytocola gossypii TaxID=2812003 RepID=A0ABT2JEW6_9PSEU|nr:SRPBCC family protein [Actinophytocola gossypii]MCT2586416.1 SRPBCC family protein [Actinophytocola gossypii]